MPKVHKPQDTKILVLMEEAIIRLFNDYLRQTEDFSNLYKQYVCEKYVNRRIYLHLSFLRYFYQNEQEETIMRLVNKFKNRGIYFFSCKQIELMLPYLENKCILLTREDINVLLSENQVQGVSSAFIRFICDFSTILKKGIYEGCFNNVVVAGVGLTTECNKPIFDDIENTGFLARYINLQPSA